MAIDIDVEKKMGGFRLKVAFSSEKKVVGLLGASGCGKSMTLKCLAGLVKPDQGRIEVNGEILYDSASRWHVPARQRRAGMVFQNYALFPHLTVHQNLAIAIKDSSTQQAKRQIADLIEHMHLAGLEQRYPAQLSGGQQQRVALARALVIQPRFLLLDEPFSALDPFLREQTLKWISESLRDYDGHIVFVTHNIEEAYRLCDHLVVLKQGNVDCSGSREEVVNRPPTLEAAAICGCRNISRFKRLESRWLRACDWGIDLQAPPVLNGNGDFVGIRDNAVKRVGRQGENCYKAWISDTSASLQNVKLYIKLGGVPDGPGDYHLEWCISREEWDEIEKMPPPLIVQLHPDQLFVLS